jgi:hypothetical protein
VYCIDENEWNGKTSQLRLRDIKDELNYEKNDLLPGAALQRIQYIFVIAEGRTQRTKTPTTSCR